ncbi:hypothetical protein J3R82DRAFT_2781 [Butyriboletus roseoflavus]|nr:hypothetical protein J3R82DRAFT_2781 [Butyriboletus roseoflavus]
MLIAVDIYWRKMDDNWPDWVKISEYEAEDIRHHPWFLQITFQLYLYDLDEDICTRYWRENGVLPTPTSVNPDVLEEGLLAQSEGGIKIEMDIENNGKEGPPKDVVTRQKWILLGKRKAVEKPAPMLSTQRSARLSQMHTNNPIPPQPPNVCSTCTKFGATCAV